MCVCLCLCVCAFVRACVCVCVCVCVGGGSSTSVTSALDAHVDREKRSQSEIHSVTKPLVGVMCGGNTSKVMCGGVNMW